MITVVCAFTLMFMKPFGWVAVDQCYPVAVSQPAITAPLPPNPKDVPHLVPLPPGQFYLARVK